MVVVITVFRDFNQVVEAVLFLNVFSRSIDWCIV